MFCHLTRTRLHIGTHWETQLSSAERCVAKVRSLVATMAEGAYLCRRAIHKQRSINHTQPQDRGSPPAATRREAMRLRAFRLHWWGCVEGGLQCRDDGSDGQHLSRLKENTERPHEAKDWLPLHRSLPYSVRKQNVDHQTQQDPRPSSNRPGSPWPLQSVPSRAWFCTSLYSEATMVNTWAA